MLLWVSSDDPSGFIDQAQQRSATCAVHPTQAAGRVSGNRSVGK
jgi:hypothetical protein